MRVPTRARGVEKEERQMYEGPHEKTSSNLCFGLLDGCNGWRYGMLVGIMEEKFVVHRGGAVDRKERTD